MSLLTSRVTHRLVLVDGYKGKYLQLLVHNPVYSDGFLQFSYTNNCGIYRGTIYASGAVLLEKL